MDDIDFNKFLRLKFELENCKNRYRNEEVPVATAQALIINGVIPPLNNKPPKTS